jgi:tetratricopeptide (TPR) repeat protein/predicted Ser/Thr protein kinase
MACLREDTLASYAQGLLPADERERAAAHLGSCAECRGTVALLEQLWDKAPSTSDRQRLALALFPVVPPPQLTTGTPVGRYLVLDTLGSGGMGVVYRAYDPQLDRKVALKLLTAQRDRSEAGLLREAKSLARIAHRNVVAVYDVGAYQGHLFIAMELIEGVTLRRWLEGDLKPWRETLAAFTEAAEGLAAVHEAGLVHRDFKPANVLRSASGRICVSDFGLARAAGEHADSGQASPGAPNVSATATGALRGTPAYMSPEQLAGAPADARSDQFSFCTALYEALTGVRPFAGKDIAELSANAAAARFQAPEREARLPQWLKRAVRKGLAVEPAQRHPSVRALLEALRPPLRGRATVVAGAAGLIALAAWVAWPRAATVCPAGDIRLAGVWDSGVTQRVVEAFGKTGVAYAPGLLASARAALDAYAAGWARMYLDACQATHVRHEQSEQLLDLRMACLERRRRELDATTTLLQAIDGKTLDRSLDVVYALPKVESCADTARLLSVTQPQRPEVRERSAELRAQLAQVRVLSNSAQYQAAFDRAAALMPELERHEDLLVRGEGWYWRGSTQMRLERHAPAREDLIRALSVASAVRDDELLTRTLAELTELAAFRVRDVPQAQQWSTLLRAVMERSSPDADLTAVVENQLGMGEASAGHLEPALEHFIAARDGMEKAKASPVKIGRITNNIATMEWQLGRSDAALDDMERAYRTLSAALGEWNPNVAQAEGNLAQLLIEHRRYDQATSHLNRALAIQERSLGLTHPDLAFTHNVFGDAWLARGEPAQALEHYSKALQIREAALGAISPRLAIDLYGIGLSLHQLNRGDEAVVPLERALTLQPAAEGSWADRARTEVVLGKVLIDRDAKRSRALLAAADEHFDKAGPSSAKDRAEAAQWLKSRNTPGPRTRSAE